MAGRNSWASYVIWGSVAVCAVLGASLTLALVVGSHRGIQVAAPAKRSAPPPAAERPPVQATVPAPAHEHEIARLNDALRALAAERDRLVERVEKLEQSLGDITASIRTPPREPGPAEAEPQAAAAEAEALSVPAAGVIPAPSGEAFLSYVAVRPPLVPPSASRPPMQIHAVPAPAPEPEATRTEFALDLGAGPSMEALRAHWAGLRNRHGALAKLRPLVQLRDVGPGVVELRLVAGPLGDAADAARLCAALQPRGVPCAAAVYEGQRLALR